jgi:SAM-dependent methyltransferase
MIGLRDKLSRDWQERFDLIWDKGSYRMGSPGQRIVPLFKEWAYPGASVNDYGSGTGRAAVELVKAGYKVNMVDISLTAIEPEAAALVAQNRATLTIASLWDLPKAFPVSDWGFCAEVLMTLPPDKLSGVLRNIHKTCKNLFCQVANWGDLRCGIRVNTILQDEDWWEEKLKEFWPEVKQIRSRESSLRYIFVCQGV